MRRRGPSAAALAAVFAGGSLGATARWSVRAMIGHDFAAFPWATLVTNVAGSILIGLAASRVRRGSLTWMFLVAGVLGGFTTFSAFAVETERLVELGRIGLAALYVTVTLVVGLGAHTAAVRVRGNSS